tara:strand:- start:2473 stop:2574 length:102 start_codon:yes stop_codon:yes gene_type:complete
MIVEAYRRNAKIRKQEASGSTDPLPSEDERSTD